MRVIAGEFKKRKLFVLEGMNTRPTTDRNKENMFNLIGPYFDGGKSLDLFGGSGGLSIEALSRGVDHAVIIDNHRKAIQVIQKNVDLVKANDRATILNIDYKAALERYQDEKFSVILLDPPFRMLVIDEIIGFIDTHDMLTDDGVIIAEFEQKYEFKGEFKTIEMTKFVDYGTSHIQVYRKKDA